MKFGKQLECLSIQKYKGHYIQYKELKKALKVWTGVEKDQSTVQEVTHWASSFLRLGPNPEVSPEMRLNALLRHEMERISKVAELEEGSIRKQLTRLEEDTERRSADRAALVRRLNDLGEQIVQLKAYARLNFTGFRKILKKYDKWSASRAAVTPWFMAEVVRAPFMQVGFSSLLAQLNQIAKALRKGGSIVPEDQPRSSRGTSGPFVGKEHNSSGVNELVFLIDPQDTMQVRVLLSKHLNMRGLMDTSPDRKRTTCIYLDTPNLDIYGGHLVEPAVADDAVQPAPPPPSVHLRHTGGDAAMLVREVVGAPSATGEPAGRVEVLLRTSEAAKLLHGEAASPASPAAGVPRDAAAVAGTSPQATRDQIYPTLAAVQAAIIQGGQKPLAQASYVRSAFQDDSGLFTVVLDEDVRMARVTEPFASSGISEYFPHNVLTLSWSSLGPAARLDEPMWYRFINDSTNLVQVSGFSKAAQVLAHFFSKASGARLPDWYRNVMNIEEEEVGSHDGGEQEMASTSVNDDARDTMENEASADVAVAAVSQMQAARSASTAGLHSARLLHEFGTTPQEEAAAAASMCSHREEEDSVLTPAADGGGLGAPLLSREGAGARRQVRRKGGVLQRFARLLGFAKAEEEEQMAVRDAIVAVQPKTLFSNERTFLEWMHFATILASMGVVLMHSSDNHRNVQIGRFIVLSSIFLVGWSLRTFNWRADALDGKEIRDYQDSVGPPVMMLALLFALGASTAKALADDLAASPGKHGDGGLLEGLFH